MPAPKEKDFTAVGLFWLHVYSCIGVSQVALEEMNAMLAKTPMGQNTTVSFL